MVAGRLEKPLRQLWEISPVGRDDIGMFGANRVGTNRDRVVGTRKTLGSLSFALRAAVTIYIIAEISNLLNRPR